MNDSMNLIGYATQEATAKNHAVLYQLGEIFACMAFSETPEGEIEDFVFDHAEGREDINEKCGGLPEFEIVDDLEPLGPFEAQETTLENRAIVDRVTEGRVSRKADFIGYATQKVVTGIIHVSLFIYLDTFVCTRVYETNIGHFKNYIGDGSKSLSDIK